MLEGYLGRGEEWEKSKEMSDVVPVIWPMSKCRYESKAGRLGKSSDS